MFDPVGHYSPKDAMQKRFDALREACLNYGDFMRPERFITEVVPEKDGELYYTRTSF